MTNYVSGRRSGSGGITTNLFFDGQDFPSTAVGNGNTSVTAAPAVVVLSGTVESPNVLVPNVTPSVITLTSAIEAPSVACNANVNPSTLFATFSIGTTTESLSVTVSPSVVVLSGIVEAPSVSGVCNVSVSLLSLTSSIGTQTDSAAANVSVSTLILTSTLEAPTVQTTSPGSVTINPSLLALTSTMEAPSISGNAGISASTFTLATFIYPPTPSGVANVNASILPLVSVLNAPSISGSSAQNPATLQIISGVIQPAFLANIFPSTLVLTSSTGTATVTNTNLVFPSSLILSASVIAPSVHAVQTSSINPISAIVDSQLPEFVRDNYPLFVQFLQAYFQFCEQSDPGPEFVIKNLLNYFDIDKAPDSLLSEFDSQFLANIPTNILANKRLLIKHVRDYYRARGTEKSFKFLFNILFGSEVDFYYPSTDIIRVDGGNWIQNRTIKVNALSGSPNDFVNTRIVGVASKASANVTSVIFRQVAQNPVYELFLDPTSIDGTFAISENVTNSAGIVASVYPVVTSLNIISAGSGYFVGQNIRIDLGGLGSGATASITAVDNNGAVIATALSDFGANYSISPVVTFPTTSNVATGSANLGALCVYPGFFENDDGKLDSSKFLQDDYFYQQFSYALKSDQNLSDYRAIVKREIHPAGLKLFGIFQVEDEVDGEVTLPTNGLPYEAIQLISVAEASAELQQPEVEIVLTTEAAEAPNAYRLGPSLRSIERDKYKYLPSYRQPNANATMLGPNAGYWSTYANYQLKDFVNITLDQITNSPWIKTNIMPEPQLTNFLLATPTLNLVSGLFSPTISTNQNASFSASLLNIVSALEPPSVVLTNDASISASHIVVTSTIEAPSVTSTVDVTASASLLSLVSSQNAPSISITASVSPTLLSGSFSIPAPSAASFAPGNYASNSSKVALWYDISDASKSKNLSNVQAANGDAIGTLVDKSSNTKNATQTTSANALILKTAQQNGLQVASISSNVVSQFMSVPSYGAISQNIPGMTVVMVGNLQAVNTNNGALFSAINSNNTAFRALGQTIMSATNYHMSLMTSTLDGTSEVPLYGTANAQSANQWCVYVFAFDYQNAQVSITINGVADLALSSTGLGTGSNTSNTPGLDPAFTLWTNDQYGTDPQSESLWGEIVVYNEYIGSTNITNVTTALRAKWDF